MILTPANSLPETPDLRALAPAFAARFAVIIANLIALIARGLLRSPAHAPLILPLWRRLTRATRHLTTHMARLAAGEPATKSRAKATRTGPEPRQRAVSPYPPIPTTKAWLVHVLKHEAAGYRSQLNHLLNEPGISDLLDAAPATRRLLNPICRMLGIPRREAKRSGEAGDPATAVRLRAPKAAGSAASHTDSAAANLAPQPPPRSAPRPPPCEHLALRWPWSWKPDPGRKPT